MMPLDKRTVKKDVITDLNKYLSVLKKELERSLFYGESLRDIVDFEGSSVFLCESSVNLKYLCDDFIFNTDGSRKSKVADKIKSSLKLFDKKCNNININSSCIGKLNSSSNNILKSHVNKLYNINGRINNSINNSGIHLSENIDNKTDYSIINDNGNTSIIHTNNTGSYQKLSAEDMGKANIFYRSFKFGIKEKQNIKKALKESFCYYNEIFHLPLLFVLKNSDKIVSNYEWDMAYKENQYITMFKKIEKVLKHNNINRSSNVNEFGSKNGSRIKIQIKNKSGIYNTNNIKNTINGIISFNNNVINNKEIIRDDRVFKSVKRDIASITNTTCVICMNNNVLDKYTSLFEENCTNCQLCKEYSTFDRIFYIVCCINNINNLDNLEQDRYKKHNHKNNALNICIDTKENKKNDQILETHENINKHTGFNNNESNLNEIYKSDKEIYDTASSAAENNICKNVDAGLTFKAINKDKDNDIYGCINKRRKFVLDVSFDTCKNEKCILSPFYVFKYVNKWKNHKDKNINVNISTDNNANSSNTTSNINNKEDNTIDDKSKKILYCDDINNYTTDTILKKEIDIYTCNITNNKSPDNSTICLNHQFYIENTLNFLIKYVQNSNLCIDHISTIKKIFQIISMKNLFFCVDHSRILNDLFNNYKLKDSSFDNKKEKSTIGTNNNILNTDNRNDSVFDDNNGTHANTKNNKIFIATLINNTNAPNTNDINTTKNIDTLNSESKSLNNIPHKTAKTIARKCENLYNQKLIYEDNEITVLDHFKTKYLKPSSLYYIKEISSPVNNQKYKNTFEFMMKSKSKYIYDLQDEKDLKIKSPHESFKQIPKEFSNIDGPASVIKYHKMIDIMNRRRNTIQNIKNTDISNNTANNVSTNISSIGTKKNSNINANVYNNIPNNHTPQYASNIANNYNGYSNNFLLNNTVSNNNININSGKLGCARNNLNSNFTYSGSNMPNISNFRYVNSINRMNDLCTFNNISSNNNINNLSSFNSLHGIGGTSNFSNINNIPNINAMNNVNNTNNRYGYNNINHINNRNSIHSINNYESKNSNSINNPHPTDMNFYTHPYNLGNVNNMGSINSSNNIGNMNNIYLDSFNHLTNPSNINNINTVNYPGNINNLLNSTNTYNSGNSTSKNNMNCMYNQVTMNKMNNISNLHAINQNNCANLNYSSVNNININNSNMMSDFKNPNYPNNIHTNNVNITYYNNPYNNGTINNINPNNQTKNINNPMTNLDLPKSTTSNFNTKTKSANSSQGKYKKKQESSNTNINNNNNQKR
ncbi:hypothetical protein EDEG_03061 [Edhazardia aedis USNM 41457]|uniref:Uncharacterized protein n=1 Tax=Edhazardia aedis (strain USNM 41457) TaxID=1003232 RepID=J9D4U8_EDHAE|nr:hypothetical protein EDEG_03061 [Edhazardia aedis USNM 41457]|eukprot:EJW02549.1 hypothetical protein EDEG_03061 [Edhazardia aedis USNM 41457]